MAAYIICEAKKRHAMDRWISCANICCQGLLYNGTSVDITNPPSFAEKSTQVDSCRSEEISTQSDVCTSEERCTQFDVVSTKEKVTQFEASVFEGRSTQFDVTGEEILTQTDGLSIKKGRSMEVAQANAYQVNFIYTST